MIAGLLSQLRGALATDMMRALARFPWTAAAAALGTAYFLFDVHEWSGWTNDTHMRVATGLIAAFALSLAAALFAERRGSSGAPAFLAPAAAFALGVLSIVFRDTFGVTPPILIGGLFLLVTLAPYTALAADEGAFWSFNHDLGIGAAVAIVAQILLGGGTSAVLATLDYLFGVDIPSSVYGKVWLVAGGAVAPAVFLAFVPSTFDKTLPPDGPLDVLSRAIAALVRYLLIPLLLIYALILHAYAVKIGIGGSLPKGQLGWMVSTYGAVLAATALLSYTTRASGPLERLFWRVWPWLLAAPVILLLIAAAVRIGAYNLTQDRYLLLLAGAWLVSLIVSQGIFAARRDIRWIVGAAAILLLAAAFGPWGASSLPARLQAGELIRLLESAGFAKDGRVTKDPASAAKLANGDARAVDIVSYLDSSGRLDVLAPLFAGDRADPFQAPPSPTSHLAGAIRDRADPFQASLSPTFHLARAIRDRLGIDPARFEPAYYNLNAPEPYVLNVENGRRLAGPVRFSAPQKEHADLDGGRLEIAFDGRAIAISDETAAKTARFDLRGLSEAMTQGNTNAGAAAAKPKPFRLSRASGDLPVEILVTNANGTRAADGEIDFTYAAFWVLSGPGP